LALLPCGGALTQDQAGDRFRGTIPEEIRKKQGRAPSAGSPPHHPPRPSARHLVTVHHSSGRGTRRCPFRSSPGVRCALRWDRPMSQTSNAQPASVRHAEAIWGEQLARLASVKGDFTKRKEPRQASARSKAG